MMAWLSAVADPDAPKAVPIACSGTIRLTLGIISVQNPAKAKLRSSKQITEMT